MHHLQPADSVETYIEDLTYTSGSLGESDGDEDLAKPIDGCLGKIKKLQADGVALANEALRQSASERRRRRKLRKVSDEFEKVDLAFCASPEGKGAKPVYASTSAGIFGMVEAKFDGALDGLLKRTKGPPALPAAYKDVARRFVSALASLRSVQARQAANVEKRSSWSGEVTSEKEATIVEMHRLEGLLKARHPDDPEEVELAFRPVVRKKAKPAAPKSEQKTGTDGAGGASETTQAEGDPATSGEKGGKSETKADPSPGTESGKSDGKGAPGTANGKGGPSGAGDGGKGGGGAPPKKA